MMEDETLQSRHLEWQAFHSLALTVVRDGVLPETTDGERIERLFQIVELPSFDAVTGWEIFRVTTRDAADSSSRYIVARTRWEQKRDMDMLYHPVERLTMLRLKYRRCLSPTLAFTVHPLHGNTVHEVESTMARLLSTPVLPFPSSNRSGLDGTSYELAMGDFGAGLRFHWWGQAPPEWGFLQETVMPLLNTLESEVQEEVQR